jgi:hypothetical protein
MPGIATTLEGIVMNRNIASALATGTTIAAAALAAVAITAGNAYADDITIDPTPFVSTRSRAEVRAELLDQPELTRTAASEWAMQQDSPHAKSTYTSEQAKAEYKVSRQFVSALNSEDSGSAYFMKRAPSH